MSVLAFVTVFVLLGLGALFLAMSGGPAGARKRMQTQTRRGRRGATLLFVLSIVVLGIAIPALVISSERDRKTVPDANVAELTAREASGRELFGQRCRNCHSLAAANATAKVGPNLDELRPPKALVLDAIEKGRARGNGNMAADLVEGEEAEAVAQFVAKAVGTDQPQ